MSIFNATAPSGGGGEVKTATATLSSGYATYQLSFDINITALPRYAWLICVTDYVSTTSGCYPICGIALDTAQNNVEVSYSDNTTSRYATYAVSGHAIVSNNKLVFNFSSSSGTPRFAYGTYRLYYVE